MMEFGIITSLASRNMPGYDLIAHNLKKKRDCRISVKYRKALNCDGFHFNYLEDFDIFVGVLGKRGRIGETIEKYPTELLAECYVLSKSQVKRRVQELKAGRFLLPRRYLKDADLNKWSKIL
jgi:hypothetical protein